MAKKIKNKSTALTSPQTDLLMPVKIDSLGTESDPCFGKYYDLSTSECRRCGDSEFCCLKTAEYLGKKREELQEEHHFKDLEDRIDTVGLKKYVKRLIRKGKAKKEILEAMQAKYEVTLKEARAFYKQNKNNG